VTTEVRFRTAARNHELGGGEEWLGETERRGLFLC